MINQTITLTTAGNEATLTVPDGAKGALISFEHASSSDRIARYWRQSTAAPTTSSGIGCINNDKLELTEEELRSFKIISLVDGVTIQVDYDQLKDY